MFSPVAGLHLYDEAPEAKREALVPKHMAALGTTISGSGWTVTVVDPVAVHPNEFVARAVYVVVIPGVAIGDAQFVHDNPRAGVQL